MTKKFTPRPGRREAHPPIDNQVSRDAAAMILPLSLIRVPTNVRTELESIEELAMSIKLHGLMQPLIVARVPGGFELVAGQRRLAALKHCGASEAPVRIVGAGEDDIALLRLIENIQRQELTGIDEISAVARLAPMFDGSRTALADALGKSPAYVSRCIKAATVVEALDVCDVAKLTKSMLFELAEASDPHQLLQELQSGRIKTVREARAPSGPIAGGRYVEGAIQFKERPGAFNLRLNFDRERTPEHTRLKIIEVLEALLVKLKY